MNGLLQVDNGGNADDLVKAIEKAVSKLIKEETARFAARAEGHVRKVGETTNENFRDVNKNLRDVKNMLNSLEDHAGRISESRLRERAIDELWRGDSAKGAQTSFRTIDDLLPLCIATPRGADKKALFAATRSKIIGAMDAEVGLSATMLCFSLS